MATKTTDKGYKDKRQRAMTKDRKTTDKDYKDKRQRPSTKATKTTNKGYKDKRQRPRTKATKTTDKGCKDQRQREQGQRLQNTKDTKTKDKTHQRLEKQKANRPTSIHSTTTPPQTPNPHSPPSLRTGKPASLVSSVVSWRRVQRHVQLSVKANQ